MKVLVLGSDGQIGRSLSQYLKDKNHEVIEFDICRDIAEDLRIPDVLDDILPNVDFVFFLAFDVGGSIYLNKYQNTYDFLNNNIKLMSSTFDSLRKHNKKFIFTSTQMSNMTHSPYGVLKRLGEIYTDINKGMMVKCWNVYGYEADLTRSHVITDFILMAKNKSSISMRTNGLEKRQLLYSVDCSECLVALMEKYDDIDKNQELHISSFKWNTVIEIAEIISKEFNNCEIVASDLTDNVQMDKGNEPNEYILNFWHPKTEISEGIKEIIKMYI